jgi:ATPase subunit of ABC transporter with duplicated ATPase domains
VTDLATRRIGELSGGERKRLVLDVLLTSGADVLLLDEPDNYLDVPTRAWLEEQIRACPSTILLVSHDRTLLSNVATKVDLHRGIRLVDPRRFLRHVPRGPHPSPGEARRRPRTVEAGGAAPLPAHEDHEAAGGAELQERHQGERRRDPMGEVRQGRPATAAGPRPADPRPAPRRRLGARVVRLTDVSIGDLFLPFSHEIVFGERIGLIGPNGTGKTHLLNALAGLAHGDATVDGRIEFGPRTSVGMFTQVNDRPEFRGRTCLDIVRDRRFDEEQAMKALARYRIGRQSRQEFQTLSGGQKARLEILCLELDGHNVLLLDEPTDNLDIESSEALEQASTASRAPSWRSATTARSSRASTAS